MSTFGVFIRGEKSYILAKLCPNVENNYYKESRAQFLHTYGFTESDHDLYAY